jgi:hypothetical protein
VKAEYCQLCSLDLWQGGGGSGLQIVDHAWIAEGQAPQGALSTSIFFACVM